LPAAQEQTLRDHELIPERGAGAAEVEEFRLLLRGRDPEDLLAAALRARGFRTCNEKAERNDCEYCHLEPELGGHVNASF
jgi:hypothetical protein